MQNNTTNLGLGGLAALVQNPEVRGAWYNTKEIKLDGYKFIDCRFDNCKLHITSSNFELERCFIDESTVIVYGNDIAKPIRLFNARYDWVYENMPYFSPTKNTDGTISI